MYLYDINIFAKNEKELETLVQTIRIYSHDLRMEFGIGKCALLVKKRKKEIAEGIELPNQEGIRTLSGIIRCCTVHAVKYAYARVNVCEFSEIPKSRCVRVYICMGRQETLEIMNSMRDLVSMCMCVCLCLCVCVCVCVEENG